MNKKNAKHLLARTPIKLPCSWHYWKARAKHFFKIKKSKQKVDQQEKVK